MNKLVIVGNGFDKAHGLPTSYCDFINHFWKKFQSRYREQPYKNMILTDDAYDGYFRYANNEINAYSDLQKNLEGYSIDYDYNYSEENCYSKSGDSIFVFKNHFLKIISKASIENWVDIENVYYELLKAIIEGNLKIYDGNITKLNSEFHEVKNELEKYLKDEVQNKFHFNIDVNNNPFLNIFRLRKRDLKNDIDNSIFLEFPTDSYKDLIDFDTSFGNYSSSSSQSDLLAVPWPEIKFLNFNYTKAVEPYVNAMNNMPISHFGRNASQIQIHGQLDSRHNPINFGFGDEMDEHYKIIEKNGDNAYLQNIKSFQYLHNSNYRHLLNWIEAKDFQVFIFGHSCGLSDRTMLNTIFEHDNCKSIKIFYREKTNNFTELTQNISRHFDDKKKMRSKIVDKSLCDPFSQEVRFSVKI
jgi:hypothetical protein